MHFYYRNNFVIGDKMNAKISVIVPIYNVELYLPKCIESIINQTYKDLEIILVDDGSPDRCGEICDEYALQDARIKVIHKENGGLSDARNAGLDVANGQYVSFIDSDDFINENFYETLEDMIVRYNADIVQCEFLKVDEYEVYDFDDVKELCDERVDLISSHSALDNLFNEKYVNTVVVWNKLYKRCLFKEIRYPKGKINEDEYTTYKVIFNAKKIAETNRAMYYYVQRPNSIMGQGFNLKRLDILEAYYDRVLFFNENKLFDLEKKAREGFEATVRGLMVNVLKSNSHNKNEILDLLIDYYRKNYTVFNRNIDASFKKRTIMLLFKYSPNFMVKHLCLLMCAKAEIAIVK